MTPGNDGGCCCPNIDVTVTFGAPGGDCNESRVGVIFFRRPRFFVGDSNRSSGGFANSDAFISFVFCTSIKLDVINPRGLEPSICIIDGSGSCGGMADDACAITEDVCCMADVEYSCGGRPCGDIMLGIFSGILPFVCGGNTDVCCIVDNGGSCWFLTMNWLTNSCAGFGISGVCIGGSSFLRPRFFGVVAVVFMVLT